MDNKDKIYETEEISTDTDNVLEILDMINGNCRTLYLMYKRLDQEIRRRDRINDRLTYYHMFFDVVVLIFLLVISIYLAKIQTI